MVYATRLLIGVLTAAIPRADEDASARCLSSRLHCGKSPGFF